MANLLPLALDDWPTVRHYYESPEGPLYDQLSGHVYLFLLILTQLPWPISFVVAMSIAPRYNLARVPLGIVYIVKYLALGVELFWFRRIWRETERQVWSEDFGRADSADPVRYYDILNSTPSVLLGVRQAVVLVCAGSILMGIGFGVSGQGWARWGGTMVYMELFLRALASLSFKKLPSTRIGQKLADYLRAKWILLRPWLLSVRDKPRKQLERVRYEDREIATFEAGRFLYRNLAIRPNNSHYEPR